MLKKLEEIFNNYDYGFDLNFISSKDWEKIDNLNYSKIIYLEKVSEYKPPIKATFNVLFNSDLTVKYVYINF